MEKTDGEKLAIVLFRMVEENKKEIKNLTYQITEFKNDLNPENSLKIEQCIMGIISSMASFCPSSEEYNLHYFELTGKIILADLRRNLKKKNQILSEFSIDALVHKLVNFCVEANAWHPIDYDFNMKGSNLNITVNFPKTLNIASMVNYLKGKS